jgi:hypothetical protein
VFRGGATASGNAAITGGSIAGVTGVPVVLYRGGVPLISLSSGSVSAAGAISGITALPLAYPNAYCYFPANIVATVAAAGWYYCTFSTTTAGTVFLNTWTPGNTPPDIPAAPTAVTDGKGAFTGDTGEEFGPTVTVPVLGVNSELLFTIYTTQTNNANAKTVRVRLSGNAGTIFISSAAASTARGGFIGFIKNTGAVAKQISGLFANNNAGAITSDQLGTVDTGSATTAVISLQKATATDNIILVSAIAEARY